MSSPPPLMNPIGADSLSQSISPSILTLILVLSITVIVSTSLCFIIRYIGSRCNRLRNNTNADISNESHVTSGVVSNRDQRISSRRVSPEDQSLIDSLPLFTLQSVSGSFSGGDCAVCLSKFEPDDQLRLLPICCHAFHAECVDTWLQSNQTCPLCRSPLFVSEADILSKVLQPSTGSSRSFRIEIGSISRREEMSDSSDAHRSYTIGSFNYVVENESHLFVAPNHLQHSSKLDTVEPPGPSLAAEVGGSGRSWLREYVDMISDRVSLSSSALSFRSSGRFFTCSSRRNDVDLTESYDVENDRIGEEISEWFRCISGV